MLNQYRYKLGQFSVGFATFKLTGPDAFSFLQSQSTFDMRALPSGHFNLMALLDPQGRTECYGWVMRSNETFYYLVPEMIKAPAQERLHRFLISEEVEISSGDIEPWTVVIGPQAHDLSLDEFYQGKIFDEEAFILRGGPVRNVPQIPVEDIETWRVLNGWPSFDGADFAKDLINHQRLFDLSVSSNKGCYPGQETVSKIATRRGAAYAPVLLEVTRKLPAGEISNFGRKIGTISESHFWEGKFYSPASLLRDFRVEGMKLTVNVSADQENAIVHYYPLLPGDRKAKALELYYSGLDFFKTDNYGEAEKALQMAIKIDPQFADAYESLGVILGREERFIEALEVMKKLSEVDPTSVLAHTNMSLFLMRLGKIEEAEEQKSLATVKSFQKFGEEAQQKERLEKELRAKQEEWLKRESMFLQVLEIDAEDTLANYGIGSIAVEKGEWEKARKHLEKVLKIDPKYSVAYLALGKAYLSLGLKEEAKKTWKEGISVAAGKGDLMPANQMQIELESL